MRLACPKGKSINRRGAALRRDGHSRFLWWPATSVCAPASVARRRDRAWETLTIDCLKFHPSDVCAGGDNGWDVVANRAAISKNPYETAKDLVPGRSSPT